MIISGRSSLAAAALALATACGADESAERAADAAVGDTGGQDATQEPSDASPDPADAPVAPPDTTSADASPPADASPLDAAAPDAAAPDAAPEPASLLCTPCAADGTCAAPAAVCLTNQGTGEQFCGLDCAATGECPRGASCFDLGEGVRQCAPVAATCLGWPPSDLGAPCAADADCRLGADTCAHEVCTRTCQTEADCAPGWRNCLGGLCQPDWAAGPEGCGRLDTACGEGGACGDGRVCYDGLLPEPLAPFCTKPCAEAGDCAGGETCAALEGGSFCLPRPCACLAPNPDDPLDQALAAAGLTRCGAIFARDVMALFPENLNADGWRLGFFDRVHRESPRALGWGRAVTDDLARAEAEGGAGPVLRELGALLQDTPLPAAAPEAEPDLVEALRAIWAAGGDEARFDEGVAERSFGDMPPALQQALARILAAAARSAVARDTMLTAAGLDAARGASLFDRLPGAMVALPGGIDFANPQEVQALQRGLDFGPFVAEAAALAAVVESVNWGPIRGTTGFHTDLPTPLGRILIQDAETQTVSGDRHYLLVLDTGGDDRYEAAVAATRAFTEPVSLLVDLAGNDRYGYAQMDAPPEVAGVPPADAAGRGLGGYPASRSEVPRQGVGILGAGLLFDLDGDDTYLSLRLSQGAAVGGVGLLVDSAGRDTYGCEQGCQGAAAFGVAAHIDRAGDDTYGGVQMVQGYAGIRGVGYLHDKAGSDRYTALPGEALFGGTILYGNPQNPNGSNTSFAQGAGFGRRADADGTYASGGLGILQDLAGDDVYTCDIFGQATGYWFGTGVLRDRDGADIYNGRWYVQGSSAHFAMSLFYEDAGDDRYNEGLPLADGSGMLGGVIMATATGQGHDFSVGYLVDAAGNDHYVGPGLGIGGGNDNGIGYFLEGGGDDRYDAPDGTTFGGANIGDRGEPFEAAMCLGIFVDADGDDVYPTFEGNPEALVGNDRTWGLDARKPMHKPGEHGGGVDLVGAHLELP